MNSVPSSSRIFMSWMSEVLVAQEAADHLAVGREDEDALMALDVDVAFLVDDDAAVGRPERRLAVGPRPQPGTVSNVIRPQPIRTGWASSAA